MTESLQVAHSNMNIQCYFEPKVHDHTLYFQLCNLNRYLLLPIAISGIFCNACALVFLYRPPKITSGVFVYLKALLILDHLMLISTLAKHMIPQICDTQYDPSHTFFGVCHLHRRFMRYPMPKIESLISTWHVWTIAALSAHRYWKISRPVISRLRDTVSLAHTLLFIMLSIVFIYQMPNFLIELELRFKPKFQIIHRRAATQVMNKYRFIYHSILDPLVINVIPFLIMCYFSLMTLAEIYRSRFNTYQNLSYSSREHRPSSSSHPLAGCFPKKAELLRQKQEIRATFLIVVIILLYLCFHSLKLYSMGRKWQLLLTSGCPTRRDYYQSHLSDVLSMISASVNAFVFIAFTNHLKTYIQLLLRKTSRTFSNSSENPPISPKTITSIESYNHFSI